MKTKSTEKKKQKGRIIFKYPSCFTTSSCQVIPSKLPPAGLRRCDSLLVGTSVYVSVNFFFFFFLREVLVDNLLPAAVAASCSSHQWEKEPRRRVGRAGGRVSCSRRRQSLPLVWRAAPLQREERNTVARRNEPAVTIFTFKLNREQTKTQISFFIIIFMGFQVFSNILWSWTKAPDLFYTITMVETSVCHYKQLWESSSQH